MRSWLWCSVFAVCSLLACGPATTIATPEGLYGFWRPESKEHTVFAFAAPADAEALFSLSANMVAPQTKPVSAVYQNDSLMQLATYSATATELTQEVLVDANAAPGTKYATKIFSFERSVKMRLASKQDPSGARDWRYFDFCPESGEFGWRQLQVSACPNPLAFLGAGTFDAQGRFFAYANAGGSGGSCPPAPGFLETGLGCGFTISDAPATRASALAVGSDSVIRFAFLDSASNLKIREKPVGGTVWQETTLSDVMHLATPIAVVHPRGVPTIVTTLKDAAGWALFQKMGDTWQRASLPTKTDGSTFTGLSALKLGPDGSFWVIADTRVFHAGAGGFAEVTTPQTPGDFYVDPDGKLHLLTSTPRGLEYAVQTDTGFQTFVIDQGTEGRIATFGSRPLRAIVRGPVQGPGLPWQTPTLITVFDDGHMESELAGGGSINVIPNVSSSWSAVGPRGEIAASLTGETAMIRSHQGRVMPIEKNFVITIDGPGATVSSSDGRFTCNQPRCEFTGLSGERLQMIVKPVPGATVSSQYCDRQTALNGAPCWFSVISPPSASTAPTINTFSVKTVSTPVTQAWTASAPVGWATRASVVGDWVTASVIFQSAATTLPFAGASVAVTGGFESQGLIGVNPSTQASWFLAVPKGPAITAVRADPAGGQWALLNVLSPTQVGGRSLGSSTTFDVVRLHVNAQGAIDTVTPVASTPKTTSLMASALGPEGTAVAIISGGAALSTLGTTENNALVQLDAAGQRSVTGFAMSAGAQSAQIAFEGSRVAWAMNVNSGQSTLWFSSAGQLTSKTITGGSVLALAVDASRLMVGIAATQPVTIDTTMLTGSKHLVRFNDTLGVSRTLSFSEPGASKPTSWAIGLLPDSVGFLSDGALRWRSDTLEQLGNPIALPSTTTVTSGVPGLSSHVVQGRWFILSQVDALFGPVAGPLVIAELKRF